MTEKTDDLLPSASANRVTIAQVEGRMAEEFARKKSIADAEKQALLDRFSKPSGVDDEERLKRAAALIRGATSNGLMRVQVGRFPNVLFTDRGRAINQQEPGWEETLTGLPKELYLFWQKHLEPKGYQIKFQIVDYQGGMPGDVGISLSWEE